MLTEFGYSTTSITSYDPASNYLSTSSAILSAELTGTFCVSSQITRSNPTHTSASISTSDVNFQINDQSFSVASENKFQTIPDLTCAALGSTKTITYTINDYPGYSITSWVSIDSVSGQLTINAPSVTSDKLYKFYVNSAISTLSSPIQKTILLTVTSCKVANCQTCSSSSSSACSVCVTNYSLSSGACLTSYSSSSVPSSETNNHTAKTLGLVSASIVGAVSCVVVLSSLMSTSSMTSLWSLINQVQIFFLLLLSLTFIPDDVQNVITGPKFALNPFGYIPFDYFNLYRSLVNVFDFRLSNSLLDLLEIKSDSTIYNCSSLIITTIICVLFHSIIYLLNKCCSRSQPNENTSKCAKVTKCLISKVFIFLTFGFYIRICLEMNQYLLVSSINEIHQFNFHEGLRITSLAVAFLVLALCLSLMTASLYLICSSYKTVENQHNKLEEFFAGLKPNKKHRFYASVLLFRRTLFVSVLLVFDSTSPEVLVIVLSVMQLIYSAYLIILRPFEEVKSCIIEILNEIYTLTLFVTLIFLNTKEEWGSTKTLAFVWVLSSNSMMTFIIVFIDSIRMLVKKCMKKNSVANKVPRTTTNQIPPRMKQMQKQQMNSNLRIESNQDQSINGLKEENKVDFYKKQTKSPIYHSRMNL